jgi:sugar/nucleoside kinase (ribokinase family)
MSPRIAAVGEVAEDVYLPEEDRHLGGISCNFARAARKSGAAAALFAAVGDDDRGRRLLAALERSGFEPLRVRTLAGASARQLIRLEPSGERIFCGFDAGVMASYRLSADELAELAGFHAVAVPCSPESAAVLAQCLTLPSSVRLVADFSQDSLTELEPAIRRHAPRLALAFVGGTLELRAPLARLAGEEKLLVVLTAGAAGAFAFDGERELHQPSAATALLDTTGCGDAFAGAFAARWLAGASLAEALHAGADRAASVARQRGAGG